MADFIPETIEPVSICHDIHASPTKFKVKHWHGSFDWKFGPVFPVENAAVG
jgi:hypothetical protein